MVVDVAAVGDAVAVAVGTASFASVTHTVAIAVFLTRVLGVGAVVDVIGNAIAVAVAARAAATEESARGVQSDGGQAAVGSTDVRKVTRSVWRTSEAAEIVVGRGEILVGVLNNARIVGQGDQVVGAVEEQAASAGDHDFHAAECPGWRTATEDHNAAVRGNHGARVKDVPNAGSVADAPVGDVNVAPGGVQDFEVFLVVEVADFAIPVAVVLGGVVEVEFIQDHAAAEALIGHAVAVVVVGGAVLNIAIVQNAIAVAVTGVSFASIANTIFVAVALVCVWSVDAVVAAVGDAVAVDITQGVVGEQDGGVRSGHVDRDIVHPSEVAGFATRVQAAFNHQAVAGAAVGVKGPRVAHLFPADVRGVRGVATR